jgi:2,3-bisphosphoglycerate-independent phosphoglycerate mutase
MSLIVVMIDGLGLAPTGPHNPLSTEPLPRLAALLGGPLTSERVQHRPGLTLQPIDATFGVPGLPQSGTGHTALVGGIPAPQLIGRHQPAFPPRALHATLADGSLFRRAQALGRRVALANAYSPGYWQALAARRTRRTASTIAAEAAGIRLRDLDDLRAGRAVYWDITNAALSRWLADAPPPVDPELAGARLAVLAQRYDLVYYECFLTDLAAHGRTDDSLADALARVDGLVGGLLNQLAPGDSLVLTSDHGHLEDSSDRGHTRNPVPLLAYGPAAESFRPVRSIAEVADAVIGSLKVV